MSSRSGGLLELVSRGKKDVFFTANPVISHVHSVYTRQVPFTKETYVTKPRNNPVWGKTVEFPIDHRGDIITDMYLRIQLPTWIPASLIGVNHSGLITDPSGVTFGYTNSIGFLMLERIQLLMDNVIVHELYGEYLDWRLRQLYEYSSGYVLYGSVGARESTPLALARSATLNTLRVPIPIAGWQSLHATGLPLCALQNQRFRLRITLRPLSQLLQASDGRLNPNPYGIPMLAQSSPTGLAVPFTTIKQELVAPLEMNLEIAERYVSSEIRTYLQSLTYEMPFKHIQQITYTLDDPVLTAAANSSVEAFQVPIKVEFIGPVDRLILGIRSEANTCAGDLTNLRPPFPGTRYVNAIRLNIANIDRIQPFPPAVFREFTSYWKDTRMALDYVNQELPHEIYSLTFADSPDLSAAGTLHFTRAVLPTLYLTLNRTPYDRRNINRKATVSIYAESWNVLQIRCGYAALMFDDS